MHEWSASVDLVLVVAVAECRLAWPAHELRKNFERRFMVKPNFARTVRRHKNEDRSNVKTFKRSPPTDLKQTAGNVRTS